MFVMMILMVVVIMITISLLMMTDNDQISERTCERQAVTMQSPTLLYLRPLQQSNTKRKLGTVPWSTFSVDKTSSSIETKNLTEENMYNKRKYFESMKV